MSLETPLRKKLPWLKLGVALGVVLILAVLSLRGVDVRGWIEQGMRVIREAGPVAFFLALALLPAVGAPVLAFVLAVGLAFGESLGMGWVVALSLLAITLNMVLTYALARGALHPLLERLMARLGYRFPQAGNEDAVNLILIFRLTPGIPFCVQNYALGLARVPFGKYLILTCLLSWPQTAAVVVFGDALLHGKGQTIVFAGGLIVALVAATHLVRKHYLRKTRQL